ncbi:MAG: hypothetical protein ACLQQ4_10850, partial [Bacteroidia bacterium]
MAVVLLVSAGSARAMVHKGDRDSIKPTEFLPAAPVGDSLKDTSHSTLPPTNFVLNPIIGAAMGITSYFGNVKAVNSYAQNPATGR